MSELENVEIDYTQLEVVDIVENLKSLKGQSDILSYEDEINKAVTSFNTSLNADKQEALKRFLEDGGVKEGFEFRLDDAAKECDSLIKDIKDAIKTARSNKSETLKKNKLKKESLVEELRAINDSSDIGNKSLNRVKEIQEEWRNSDPVASTVNNELWPNYKGLLDIFYANRKLTFNLKDLDRKRNLEEKEAICIKAEALANIQSINEGSILLNDLHKKYKTIGPVPEEQSEPIWERFRAATIVFHEKRDVFMEQFKQKLDENLISKIELLEQYGSFIESLDGEVFWKDAIKAFEDLEAQWKTIGKVPNDKIKGVNDVYWSMVRVFLNKRNNFYKELDGMRDEAQKVKDSIMEELTAVIESDDFLNLKNKVLDLQKKWWDSGSVSKKITKDYNTKFKKLCDSYFNKVRDSFAEQDKEFETNLESKKQLIASFVESIEKDVEGALETLQSTWTTIGEVAHKKAKEVEGLIETAIDKIEAAKIDDDLKDTVKSKLEVLLFAGHPNAERLIADKIQDLRKKISTYEYDKGTLETNKDFFGRSKNAEKILKEFDDKIADLEKVISKTKSKIQLLRKS